jgi:hypothetical protein
MAFLFVLALCFIAGMVLMAGALILSYLLRALVAIATVIKRVHVRLYGTRN